MKAKLFLVLMMLLSACANVNCFLEEEEREYFIENIKSEKINNLFNTAGNIDYDKCLNVDNTKCTFKRTTVCRCAKGIDRNAYKTIYLDLYFEDDRKVFQGGVGGCPEIYSWYCYKGSVCFKNECKLGFIK